MYVYKTPSHTAGGTFRNNPVKVLEIIIITEPEKHTVSIRVSEPAERREGRNLHSHTLRSIDQSPFGLVGISLQCRPDGNPLRHARKRQNKS